MSERVAFKEHHGKQVLRVDLRSATRDENLASMRALEELMAQQAPVSVNLLGVAGENEFDPEIFNRWRGTLLGIQSKVKRSAMTGFEGVALLAVRGYIAASALLGNELGKDRGVYFDTEQEAMDWLAKD